MKLVSGTLGMCLALAAPHGDRILALALKSVFHESSRTYTPIRPRAGLALRSQKDHDAAKEPIGVGFYVGVTQLAESRGALYLSGVQIEPRAAERHRHVARFERDLVLLSGLTNTLQA